MAQDSYSLDENGYIVFGETTVPEAQRQLARRGARAWPKRAIIVVEDGAVPAA